MSTTRVLSPAALPALLRDVPRVPEVVYLTGEPPRVPSVAIVGTRQPSRGAAGFARQLAGELAAAGVTILSGGAKGIDAAAHRGALDVEGHTVVVAPSSYDKPYPEEHVGLYREIVDGGGGYLTLEESGTPATYAQFFARNGLLVALAEVVIVVEAGYRSGARNAAKQARECGRVVFVVPSVPWNPRGRGCLLELKLGARPLLAASDVLELLRERQLHPIERPGAASRVVPVQLSLDLETSLLRAPPTALDAADDAELPPPK